MKTIKITILLTCSILVHPDIWAMDYSGSPTPSPSAPSMPAAPVMVSTPAPALVAPASSPALTAQSMLEQFRMNPALFFSLFPQELAKEIGIFAESENIIAEYQALKRYLQGYTIDIPIPTDPNDSAKNLYELIDVCIENLDTNFCLIDFGSNYKHIFEYLLKKGADINKISTVFGTTPLTQAIEESLPNAVANLIQAGADVNKMDNEGNTPLTFAIKRGKLNDAILLINAKADVNKPNNKGETPLFWATRYNNQSIVDALLKAGATPLGWADWFRAKFTSQ